MKPENSHSSRSQRFHAGLPATIEIAGREFTCRAHDLSRTGTLLVGELPGLESGEVWVTLRSPAGDLRLTVATRVVRRAVDDASGESSIGVEFLEIHRDDRAILDALIARVIEGVSLGDIDELPDNATPQQIRAALESTPLPHRIQLATRGLPQQREILRHDPHMQVLDALARNPSVLLHEVLAILRLPNLLPHTLEVIARDSRWAGSEQAQILAATHRNTPLAAAVALVSKMSVPTLRKVIQASDLNPALRAKILPRIPGGRRP